MRECQGCDEVGGEILDKALSLPQTGVVAVADPVAAAALTNRNARVLPSSLQLGHPLLGEESCPRSEEADLELAPLTGKRVQPPVSAQPTAGV